MVHRIEMFAMKPITSRMAPRTINWLFFLYRGAGTAPGGLILLIREIPAPFRSETGRTDECRLRRLACFSPAAAYQHSRQGRRSPDRFRSEGDGVSPGGCSSNYLA